MTDSVSGAVERRPGKRERLTAAATQLLHQQGIERTTLADIAKAADVPAGKPGSVMRLSSSEQRLPRGQPNWATVSLCAVNSRTNAFSRAFGDR